MMSCLRLMNLGESIVLLYLAHGHNGVGFIRLFYN